MQKLISGFALKVNELIETLGVFAVFFVTMILMVLLYSLNIGF